MATNAPRRQNANIYLQKILIGALAHAVADVVTNARCSNCNRRVILYFCVNCGWTVPRRWGSTPS